MGKTNNNNTKSMLYLFKHSSWLERGVKTKFQVAFSPAAVLTFPITFFPLKKLCNYLVRKRRIGSVGRNAWVSLAFLPRSWVYFFQISILLSAECMLLYFCHVAFTFMPTFISFQPLSGFVNSFVLNAHLFCSSLNVSLALTCKLPLRVKSSSLTNLSQCLEEQFPWDNPANN